MYSCSCFLFWSVDLWDIWRTSETYHLLCSEQLAIACSTLPELKICVLPERPSDRYSIAYNKIEPRPNRMISRHLPKRNKERRRERERESDWGWVHWTGSY